MKSGWMKTADVRKSLFLVIGLCTVIFMVSGCCTVKCCKSQKCKDVTACISPHVRTFMIVDDRVSGCPNTWSGGFKVMAGDSVEITNCASKAAHLKFTPSGGFFNEGSEVDVAAGETKKLTVSSTVSTGDILSWVIEAEGCGGHPGSKVIVEPGP